MKMRCINRIFKKSNLENRKKPCMRPDELENMHISLQYFNYF